MTPRELVERLIQGAFQVTLVVLAIVIGYFHAFPTSLHAEKTDYPVLDTVTLGCLGVILLAALLPKVAEISIGGTSVKLREAESAAGDYRDVAAGLANLAQNWSTSIGILAEQLNIADPATQGRLIGQYYRDRMGEAQEYLTEELDDVARVALWLYDDQSRTLEFAYANDFVPTKRSWKLGEGMIGKAFEEGRSFNEADVRSLPCYENTRSGSPPYRAVLVELVKLGDRKVGALTVDKRRAELFGPIAIDVAKGLAAQCALADYLWQGA